jgi:hypothetical protein
MGRRHPSFLTHSVEVDAQGNELRVFCKRVELENVADRYAGDVTERSTCPRCAKHFDAFAGAALHERDESWEDYLAPGEARYVPAVVLPQMPDIVARAEAAGMPPGVEYMGAGMTSVVFCDGETAFKVARQATPTLRRMLDEEAEWLVAAGNVPTVAPHVARFHRFDPLNAVIVRACPHRDTNQSLSRWESRLPRPAPRDRPGHAAARVDGPRVQARLVRADAWRADPGRRVDAVARGGRPRSLRRAGGQRRARPGGRPTERPGLLRPPRGRSDAHAVRSGSPAGAHRATLAGEHEEIECPRRNTRA